MSMKMEERTVPISYCDFCGKEAKHLEKCVLCGKEGCDKGGYATHFAFAVGEIFYYDIGFRGMNSHICKECAAQKLKMGDKEISVSDFLKKISSLPCIN